MILPDLTSVPRFYSSYVDHVKEYDLFDILARANKQTLALVRSISEEIGQYRYAEDKWSVKEVLCHMMDTERIFSYRALRFARNDRTPLPGFEEKDYAPQSNPNGRTIIQLASEMEHLRQSTIDLFRSFTPEMLTRTGSANNAEISVLNLGFVIPGHEIHHGVVLKDRYLAK